MYARERRGEPRKSSVMPGDECLVCVPVSEQLAAPQMDKIKSLLDSRGC